MAEQILEFPAVRQAVAASRRSPAGHLAASMSAGSVGGERGVALREIAFLTQLGLRAKPNSEAASALEGAIGLALPARVGEVAGDTERAVLWQGPDEFLLVCVPESLDTGTLAAALGAGKEALAGAVVDLSANRTTLELSGPSARSVLEKGCHYDLHPRSFPPNTAVSTELGPVPVLLWKTDEHTFRIMPRASFTDYVVHWLLDAMSEYSVPEVP